MFFRDTGIRRVRFPSDFHTGVNHQNRRVWVRASSVRVPAQWMELPRFHHRRRRVSQYCD